MLKFQDYLLNEKLIMLGGGKKYGQVCFLAGGAASGKGFVTDNFIEGDKFKIIDVDALKQMYIALGQIKDEFKEFRDFDLRKGQDVFKLHTLLKERGTKDKILNLLFAPGKNRAVLNNILFDITMKDMSHIDDNIDILMKLGYDPKNIHIVWVLTNYSIAVMQNATRSRIVPDDIMLQTHEGAAVTMHDIITEGKLTSSVDGGIYVVINNRENTIFFKDENGQNIQNKRVKDSKLPDDLKKMIGNPGVTVSDFTYLTLKKPGKPIINDEGLKIELYSWVVKNVPKTKLTTSVFGI